MSHAKEITLNLILFVLFVAIIGYAEPSLLKSREFLLGFVCFFGIWVIGSISHRILGVNKNRRNKRNTLFPFYFLISFILIFFTVRLQQTDNRAVKQATLDDLEANKLLINQNASLDKHSAELITRITQEAASTPARTLSEESIAQIASLSNSYKPYRKADADSLSSYQSPERGFLLKNIMDLNLDDATQLAINKSADYSYAILENIDWKNKNLSHANLKGAQMKDAILIEANLSEATLEEANLWGAHLSKSILDNSNFLRANLSWSKLDSASLINANFGSAIIHNSRMRSSNLTDANFTSAQLNTSLLNYSNLTRTNLFGTDLTDGVLENCNLSETSFRRTILTRCNATKAKFDNAFLQLAIIDNLDITDATLDSVSVNGADWISHQLDENSVKGREKIKAGFHQVRNKKIENRYIVIKTRVKTDSLNVH